MAEVRLAADAFIEQLLAAKVEWIFGNPGTTEQTVLDHLQDYEGIDLIVALHEGVAVGAAEGYARAAGKVGVVELHAGPGLGNGLGMLYNAKAGNTPLVVYVGQCEQSGLYTEPTLSGNFEAVAAPYSKWAYEVRTAQEIPQVLSRAFKVASTPPYGPVVLSVPIDLSDAPCSAPVVAPSWIPARVRPDRAALAAAVETLRGASAPAIIVGDGVSTSHAVSEVGELAELIGAPLFGGSLSETCVDPDEPLRGQRLPFEGTVVEKILAPYDCFICIGTKVLAQIFPTAGWPLGDRPVVHIGLDAWELAKNQPSTVVFGDERESLRELNETLRAAADGGQLASWASRRAEVQAKLEEARERANARDKECWDDSPMAPQRAIAELAGAIPPDACLCDESLTSDGFVARYTRLNRDLWFRGRGGGIGIGMPMPIGVQLAYPDRPVVSIVGDGSSMYSISSMWTAAHHNLPIVWAILNNASYRILKQNTSFHRPPGTGEGRQFVGADLTGPVLDFASIACGMGIDGRRVSEPDELAPALSEALASGKPALIDVVVSGDLKYG